LLRPLLLRLLDQSVRADVPAADHGREPPQGLVQLPELPHPGGIPAILDSHPAPASFWPAVHGTDGCIGPHVTAAKKKDPRPFSRAGTAPGERLELSTYGLTGRRSAA